MVAITAARAARRQAEEVGLFFPKRTQQFGKHFLLHSSSCLMCPTKQKHFVTFLISHDV